MRKLMIPILALGLVALLSSLFVIEEGERGIVLRFGRILKDNNEIAKVYEPGLHFRIPFFDRVEILDAKIQTMDGRSDRFLTLKQKDVIIDSYVKWRIEDFGEYYLATGGGNIGTAQTLLGKKVTDVLRSEIGSRDIKQIVSGPRNEDILPDSTDSDVVTTEAVKEALEVDGERDIIMKNVLNDTRKEAMEDLGIHVFDFRMKKINLPETISKSIYDRMRAERESVARKFRSEGREEAEKTRAEADLEAVKILAEADKSARKIRGDADAKAAKTYADAYKKDPEFFGFLRSLNAYQKSFSDKSDILVLDPKSDFFKYMNQASGKPSN